MIGKYVKSSDGRSGTVIRMHGDVVTVALDEEFIYEYSFGVCKFVVDLEIAHKKYFQ